MARMRKILINLLAIQAGMTLAIAAGFFIYRGTGAGVATLYGGGIGLVVSLLLAFRFVRANRPGAGAVDLYLGAVERFLFVGAAFAVGIAVLELAPVALLAGFVGAELAYFITISLTRGGAGAEEAGNR